MTAARQEAPVFVGGGNAEEHQRLARELLLSLAQLVSVSRFHHLENEAVRLPSVVLSDLTREFWDHAKRLVFYSEEDQVFVNERRVRFAGASFMTIQTLIRRLEAKGVAGLELRQPVSAEKLRAFLACLHGVPRGAADPSGLLEAALAEAGINEIRLIRPGGRGRGGDQAHAASDVDSALLLYARTVVLLRETMRNWEDQQTRTLLGVRIQRALQEIITLAERNPRPFLWLVQVKDEREYLYTHSANVTLLSILTGLRLGIDRNRLCAFGGAALFHEMGHLWLPEGLCSKTGPFEADDRRAMALHPIHGVNLLLRLQRLDESILTRMVVVFEHNIAANSYPRASWPPGLHLFSRIVAIASAFDAMTTNRPFRPARTSDEAMRELWKSAGDRYDRDVLRVFNNVIGVYPLGTLLRLESGELGLVLHVDPAEPRHPLVKLVVGSDGQRLADRTIIDLGDRDVSGAFRWKVAGTADASTVGINVAAFLRED